MSGETMDLFAHHYRAAKIEGLENGPAAAKAKKAMRGSNARECVEAFLQETTSHAKVGRWCHFDSSDVISHLNAWAPTVSESTFKRTMRLVREEWSLDCTCRARRAYRVKRPVTL